VQADWVVPDIVAPTQNQQYGCHSGMGIGSGSLFVGLNVASSVIQSGDAINKSFFPAFQWGPVFTIITNVPVSPGHLVTGVICANPARAGVTFTNRTTGATTTFSFDAPPGVQFVGNSAEWLVATGNVFPIADYGQVFFSACQATQANGFTVGGGTGDNINLVDGGGNVVSEGALIGPTNIWCVYTGALPMA
jgi:hypothetical protein